MSEHRNTDYEGAAKATKRLVDHGNTPDNLSTVVIETLIEMSAESRINIWHKETGLSVASLAALYRLYETGAGYRLSRRLGAYEANRIEEELKRHDVSENGKPNGEDNEDS
jgi:hypothetical protein